MRLKRNRLKQFHLRPAIPQKDNEGNTYTDYSAATAFMAEEWAAGGKLQAEMYGQRLPNIRNLRLSGKYKEQPGEKGKLQYAVEGGLIISPGDGVCLFVPAESKPDYKIISIYPYSFLTLEVERL